jgi:lysophospholipase
MEMTPIDRRLVPAGATIATWTAPDGWPLRTLEWPQPAGVKPRGSLIFAGGRGDFIEKYLEPLGHWHARGWNVASLDWRGQGGSRGDIQGGHLDSFDPLVADFAALADHWLAKHPGPHVAIAHSMGGHLLLRVLAEHRPAFAAAVLVAPMIRINARPVPHRLGRRMAAVLARIGLGRRPAWRENERPHLPGANRQAYLTSCADRYADELWWKLSQPGYALGPPTWGWLDAAYRSIDGLTLEKMAGAALPILILGTEQDRLVSPNAIRRAAQALPRAELVMYPAAAHELLRESDAVRLDVLAAIDAFLDKHAR